MRKTWLIPRRTMLKGLGVALALPLLETMGWAETPKAQGAYKPPVRLGFMYMAMGVHENMFWPKDAKAWPVTLPPTLEPLRPVIDQCLLLDGIENIGAGPLKASHELELSTWLTAARPNPERREEIDIAPSADQIAAQHLGLYTVLPSIEMGYQASSWSGLNKDSGLTNNYYGHASFRTATQALPLEISPAAVLKRLFSSRQSTAKRSGGPAVDAAKFANPNAPAGGDEQTLDRSMLDLVRDSAKDLRGTVSSDDQHRLDDYLDGIRSLETRIAAIERQQAEAAAAAKAGKSGAKSFVRSDPIEVKIPPGTPKWSEHTRLMGDLMVLAFQTDTTRVATLVPERAFGIDYPELGIKDHHELSHSTKQNNMEFGKLATIDRFNIEQFSYLVARLKSLKEGPGTLLDNCIVMWGSGMGYGDYHLRNRLPTILAGKGGGTVRTGRYVPKANGNQGDLLTAILARAGVPVDKPIGYGTKLMPDLS